MHLGRGYVSEVRDDQPKGKLDTTIDTPRPPLEPGVGGLADHPVMETISVSGAPSLSDPDLPGWLSHVFQHSIQKYYR